jgi:hypothetical protein
MAKHKRSVHSFDTNWLAERLLQRPCTPAFEQDGLTLKIETIPAGVPHCVVSMRNALFCGQHPINVSFDADVEIRHLRYEAGEWMSDSPQEIWQMREALEELLSMDVGMAHEPELLVGGLGLGVFSHLASEYAGAIVTTVERDERIIRAVAPWATRKVIQDDIYQFADKIEIGEYDAAFLDTWQRTGEYCWITEVVPLRRKLVSKIKKLWCWQEAEMVGQIRMNGMRTMCIPLESFSPHDIHYRVLRYAAEQAGLVSNSHDDSDELTKLLEQASELEDCGVARDLLNRFLINAGSPVWEAEFGQIWDRFVAENHE